MLIYQMFFRKYGVRRKEQLVSPNFTSFSTLQLPLRSMLHFVPDMPDQVGPSPQHPLLNDEWRYVYVGHVQELTSFEGFPRFIPVNYLSKIRDYQHANPKLMWLKKDPSIVIDPKSLVVMSYGGLEANYLYKREIISALYRWRNEYATVYSKVNEQAVTGFRQHFLAIELPDAVPSRNKFELAEREQNVQQMKNFRSPSLKFLLDFWIWLGNSREKSVLSKLSKEGLAHFNLILKSGDRAVILNLGMVNSWRKDVNAEEGDIQGFRPEQIQKLFLRMIIDAVSPDLSISSPDDGVAKQELNTLIKSRFDKPESEEEVPDEEVNVDPIDFNEIDNALTLHDEISDAADIVDDLTVVDSSTTAPTPEVVAAYVAPKDSLVQPIITRAREAVENGSISLAEMQRFQKLASTYETIPNPFGEGTLKDLIDIKDSDIRIENHTSIVDIPTVLDKTMLKSTLIDFDPRYIKNVLHKDIGAFLMGIQKAGYAVTGLVVTEVEDVMNHFNRYTVNVVPVSGKPSTFNMEIPVIDEEGVVLAGGVKYYLKKQHGEKPIRKTAPHRVSLTSYFGKVFVDRSENVVNNYGLWLTNQIRSIGLDKEDSRITELRLSTNFNHRIILPRVYTLLSQSFGSFSINASTGEIKSVINLSFDYENRKNILGPEKLVKAESEGNLLVGVLDDTVAVVMTPDGIFKTHPINQRSLPATLGTIETLLNLPTEKAPLEVAVLNLFGKSLPLGFILAYRLGFPVLLATLGVNYRKVPAGKQMGLQPDEYRLKFKDESWIFSRRDRVAALLLNGFNVFHRSIANYPAATFAKKDVYINIVEDAGLGSRYVKELDLMFDLFIDHITKDLLIEMKEPTDMFNLLIRATQLLLIDYYPDDGDKRFMRIKGYERIAGAVYTELVKSARYKLNNPSIVKSSLEVNPQAVKLAILTDSSKEIVEEINPIHHLKMAETVTFGGTGGRSTKTMVKSTRAYHDTDMGVISEATVDSGNVGIISYLSADPNFTSLRGTTKRFDLEADGLSSLLSTSALLSPGAENDDPKRVNFINIQHSHGIAAKGYRTSPIVTGYEQVIAHRTNDLFAYTAKQDGKVTAVTDKTISITYVDGTIKHIETGRRFGKAKGSAYPHDVITDLKEGDVFKFGDVIVYNKNFFEKDFMDPKGVSWKAGVMVRTAIMDTTDTFEDSCAISEEVAGELTSETTFIRNIVVNFDQSISRLVEVGDSVEVDSILCTIEDSVTAKSDLFDDETLDSLRLLSGSTPRAKHKGVVEKVEIFYNGEVIDMSESLGYLAQTHDRALSRLKKNLGKNKITGKVDSGYRIDGDPLGKNQLVVNVYITAGVPAGVGDKGVFGNQLKTIIGRVMTGVNRTADGQDLGGIFGYMSIANRTVESPIIMGTTNALLQVIGLQAVKIYKGK